MDGIRNCTADFLSRMCEDLDNEKIEQMRPPQNLINEEFILPINDAQKAGSTSVTKGLNDAVTSQGDKFQGIWTVYDVRFGSIRREARSNIVNSDQPLSTLNLQECRHYDHVENTVRALDDQSDLFMPIRSTRIQSRLIDSKPISQGILNTQRRKKADTSGQSDTTTSDDSSDDRSRSTSLRPHLDEKEGTEPATEQGQENKRDEKVQQTASDDCDDEDNGEDKMDTVQKQAHIVDSQDRADYEVQNVQDGIVTSKLLEGLLQAPVKNEDDYMSDEDFADIYKYIKYDILTNGNAKNKKLLLMADFYFIENNKLFKTTFKKNE